ncbi:MAG: chemotaxis protein CheW [Leptospiraceae bacterium]|nr:chemotaxis protein CheW [Leptospiraceae bacterium]
MTTEILDETTEESQDTMENLYIIFFIDGREYGIEIRYLIEIIAFQPITFIPNLPPYVKGVINLRGKSSQSLMCGYVWVYLQLNTLTSLVF